MDDEARICPFCAGADCRIVQDGNRRQVQCIHCGARGPSVLDLGNDEGMARDGAISEWNVAARLLSVKNERALLRIKRLTGGTP